MRTISFFLLLGAVYLSFSFMATKPIGVFQDSMDIGNPKLAGSSAYKKQKNEYTLSGSGYNIWFARDEFSVFVQKNGR